MTAVEDRDIAEAIAMADSLPGATLQKIVHDAVPSPAAIHTASSIVTSLVDATRHDGPALTTRQMVELRRAQRLLAIAAGPGLGTPQRTAAEQDDAGHLYRTAMAAAVNSGAVTAGVLASVSVLASSPERCAVDDTTRNPYRPGIRLPEITSPARTRDDLLSGPTRLALEPLGDAPPAMDDLAAELSKAKAEAPTPARSPDALPRPPSLPQRDASPLPALPAPKRTAGIPAFPAAAVLLGRTLFNGVGPAAVRMLITTNTPPMPEPGQSAEVAAALTKWLAAPDACGSVVAATPVEIVQVEKAALLAAGPSTPPEAASDPPCVVLHAAVLDCVETGKTVVTADNDTDPDPHAIAMKVPPRLRCKERLDEVGRHPRKRTWHGLPCGLLALLHAKGCRFASSASAPRTATMAPALHHDICPGAPAPPYFVAVPNIAAGGAPLAARRLSSSGSFGVPPALSGADPWVVLDVRPYVILPVAYALASTHPMHAGAPPRSWVLEGSLDGETWVVLRQHVNDESISGTKGTAAAWSIGDYGGDGDDKDKKRQDQADRILAKREERQLEKNVFADEDGDQGFRFAEASSPVSISGLVRRSQTQSMIHAAAAAASTAVSLSPVRASSIQQSGGSNIDQFLSSGILGKRASVSSPKPADDDDDAPPALPDGAPASFSPADALGKPVSLVRIRGTGPDALGQRQLQVSAIELYGRTVCAAPAGDVTAESLGLAEIPASFSVQRPASFDLPAPPPPAPTGRPRTGKRKPGGKRR